MYGSEVGVKSFTGLTVWELADKENIVPQIAGAHLLHYGADVYHLRNAMVDDLPQLCEGKKFLQETPTDFSKCNVLLTNLPEVDVKGEKKEEKKERGFIRCFFSIARALSSSGDRPLFAVWQRGAAAADAERRWPFHQRERNVFSARRGGSCAPPPSRFPPLARRLCFRKPPR